MCFVIIAGRNTTASGNVIMGANDDWPGYPGHVWYKPQRRTLRGAVQRLAGGLDIPQPPEVAAGVFCTCAYPTGTYSESWAFGMNEHKVSVAMTGVYAFRSTSADGGLEGDDLTVLALERGHTARQTVEMLGNLIDKYGFTVSSIASAAGAVVVGVADANEGWWLEVVPGGAWVAQRVADDMVSWRPNCFGIQEVDFNNQADFLFASNIREVAREHGWHEGSEPFVFSKIFGASDEAVCAYGNENDPVNSLRRQHAQRLVSGREQAIDEKIYDARPNRPITAAVIRDILRDSSEGSLCDLSLSSEAGPHHNPFWMQVSTSIGQSGTVLGMVAEPRRDMPSEIGALLWLACANTHLTPYIPCYIGGCGLPAAFTMGEYKHFDENSAWWIFQELGQVCYRNYEEAARKKVIPAIRKLEDSIWNIQEAVEETFLAVYRKDKALACEMLATYNKSQAEYALASAKHLIWHIKSHHFANISLQ